MRRARTPGLLLVWLHLVVGAVALADGGLVLLSEPVGPFRITVFTSPTPMRVGSAQVSVMLQDRDSERPLLDAEVSVWLSPATGAGPTLRTEAGQIEATNKLLYVARVELPSAGTWKLDVSVEREGTAAGVESELEVEPALPRWLAYWPYLVLPPIVSALFAVHQWRSRRLGRPSGGR